ncbi:MAG: SDR family NAD(P)-dependent oxidoreductase [Sulfuricurvum sp.]|uniref:SDR family oxidoreductase n=1 Tax=Sulfuricurvum sp. TaxID=2025608 RepID=UPI0026235AE7|nr:SDR family NAD(P)-dependent oxidoreductase [Sulfuricurvum sp.]MDD5161085.1 SDR family NAD(P)-dependent oxidoreductase [Sulfuricurvum sp.]
MQMKNNTILITGGTSGIGYEFARQLCEENTVIITGRDQEKLDLAKKELKNVHTFRCDIANPQEITALYAQVSRMFPELNVLINNAGVMKKIDLQEESDLTNLTQEIDTNLIGTIRMSTQFLPLLKKQKSAAIVNVTSALAFVPLANSPVYCATKAALHSFTDSMRLQLKNTDVKVFEVAPQFTQTPLIDAYESSKQNNINVMPVSKLVKIAIKKIKCGISEIKPGQSAALKMISRLSPRFALNMINKSA